VQISQLSSALFAASLFVQMASSSAQASTQATSESITGTSWRLVQFQAGDDFTIPSEDKDKYTLTFAPEGHLSARIDCNRGSGKWTSDAPGQLRIGPLALTRAMCPTTPLNKRLPRDFDFVRSYVLKNGHLFLSLQADGGIYEFEPDDTASSATAQSSTSPENTNWQLTQLGEKAITPDPQRGPNITLNSERHRVTGTGGCNRITGSYTLEGDKLKFSQMASTMMACISGMDTEHAFLDALGKTDSWKITADRLELLDASGKTVATLQPVPKEN
jgi:heat shock protein HslJ